MIKMSRDSVSMKIRKNKNSCGGKKRNNAKNNWVQIPADSCEDACVWKLTLSGRFVVARVERGGESWWRIGDVSVEMSASAAICEHSHAQCHYYAQRQGHENRVDCYTHTWSQGWKRDRKPRHHQETQMKTHIYICKGKPWGKEA